MKEEIINTIFIASIDYDGSRSMATDIYSAIEPLIEAEAQKFAGWVANQVVGGRTYNKLWLDYKQSSRIDWNADLITPVDMEFNDTP